MEIFYIQHPNELKQLAPSSVALGTFDGLHVGHQKVIQKAITLSKEGQLKAGVITFDPHPKEVLGKLTEAKYMTPLPLKLSLLKEMGLDFTIVITFSKSFAELSPEQFITQYIEGLGIRKVITGFDFCFGHRGQGTIDLLHEWGTKTRSFESFVVPSIDDQQQKISSSRIRKLLQEGEVQTANQLLGRAYRMSGKVVAGEQRGRTIGFPTANIELDYPYLEPKLGVYAVRVNRNEQWIKGVLNIGLKPTFHSDRMKPTYEIHLFEFNESIYEELITFELISYLRSERKFNGIEELKKQIELDCFEAIKRLEYIK
ncbi:bifunctional riboflavin kinase/FAD synthetase [Caldalkalibacillus mannanilyticus]|uniref:bifunctional riboflavin kinase/FAD synthetase n=1 Tax=Caldalkalibacillus mannanilyticus TaxID=1418 RepID=UPI0004697F54|nr:bifunctional riboflavin kinase/FAD synthetase [Caldalkalibacillus mannanilyticus]